MKIKEITCRNFKRFTDLTITNIPENAKLVILLGPNGCGKSSLFDAFNFWYLGHGYNSVSTGEYYNKNVGTKYADAKNVKISFYSSSNIANDVRKGFYFRSAYRNEAEVMVKGLSETNSPIEQPRLRRLNQNDVTVSANYKFLVSSTIKGVYDGSKDGYTVLQLRNFIIEKIQRSLLNIFPDLSLSNIGDPLKNGSFYFNKGAVENFNYMNLSAGEKSAFDLLFDLIIKQEYYPEAIYCVDEPELHMHTSLQAKLLRELYNLIPDNSQFWIATHSIGMLKEAYNLSQENPNTVVYIDFSGYDFDDRVEIEPSFNLTNAIWQRFIESTMGDLSSIVAPSRIVFCEGNPNGNKRKSFDSQIYNKIFSSEFPDTQFVSIGSCNDLTNSDNAAIGIFRQVFKSGIIIVIDGDDHSQEEKSAFKEKGINVLSRRHIEAYIYDKEIIRKLCEINGKTDKFNDCCIMIDEKMEDSRNRGNAVDDVKSASGDIYTELKRILDLNGCGNNPVTFARDTLASLITKDTNVYKELKTDIFG